MHIELPSNTAGRDFFLSDVHGCLDYLQKLLHKNSFSQEDRLFVLGNSINHGSENVETVDFLGEKNIYPILGFAEQLVLTAIEPNLSYDERLLAVKQWEHNGGKWRRTVNKQDFSRLALRISKWPLSITINGTKRIGLVHSECPKTNWSDFINAPATNSLKLKALTGQGVIMGERNPNFPDVDLIISGHTVVSKPPHRVGNCRYINHGIVVGNKAKLYQLKDFK